MNPRRKSVWVHRLIQCVPGLIHEPGRQNDCITRVIYRNNLAIFYFGFYGCVSPVILAIKALPYRDLNLSEPFRPPEVNGEKVTGLTSVSDESGRGIFKRLLCVL